MYFKVVRISYDFLRPVEICSLPNFLSSERLQAGRRFLRIGQEDLNAVVYSRSLAEAKRYLGIVKKIDEFSRSSNKFKNCFFTKKDHDRVNGSFWEYDFSLALFKKKLIEKNREVLVEFTTSKLPNDLLEQQIIERIEQILIDRGYYISGSGYRLVEISKEEFEKYKKNGILVIYCVKNYSFDDDLYYFD